MKLFRNAQNEKSVVAQNNEIELSDQELASVSGGCGNEYRFDREHEHRHYGHQDEDCYHSEHHHYERRRRHHHDCF
ncbi:bacteriocin [Dictyobacter arantiisoli]|uniref:Bacteriocin n=1 Tax=Dictyobacter arantiisoli TaxID=2014874 RepID=A0A5A5TEL6_9CHLR|nr:bacteriocin [Dictyobacter arantiisoli]GCF10010.1 hypothetical protein KDI_35740 [Dictyobacter arantiisoli]